MLEYDRIDISEGIDIKKCKGTSREYSLCKFYYFSTILFLLSLKAISMQNLATIKNNGKYYRANFAFISKKDAYNLIKNAAIIDKKGTL